MEKARDILGNITPDGHRVGLGFFGFLGVFPAAAILNLV